MTLTATAPSVTGLAPVIPLTPSPDPVRVTALATAIRLSGRGARYCLLQPDASGYWRAAAAVLRGWGVS